MTNSDTTFKLEKYRSGGANRFTCPHCGERKCFTRYVNVETGEYVADNCGKCDHENRCGYHYSPHEYFRDHPSDARRPRGLHGQINGTALILKKANPKPLPEYEARVPQTQFYDIHWAEVAATRDGTFQQWFRGLDFDAERKEQVLAEYYVGATAKDVVVRGVNYGPAVVFWQIDELQRVHDAKLIAYRTDGHRVDGWGNSMRAICQKSGSGPQLPETEKVLFGLHLLPRYPDKVVCLVESEKSALICACCYSRFIWLATGGCGNLQVEKLKPLMERRVVVYPDSGELLKWKEQMRRSGHPNYTVVDYFERFEPNTDIADVLLGEARLKATPWQQMKADYPDLVFLEETFDLVEE